IILEISTARDVATNQCALNVLYNSSAWRAHRLNHPLVHIVLNLILASFIPHPSFLVASNPYLHPRLERR
ncbi:hypothetical protein BX616_009444, partial [Lobosporangium transversale]